MATFLTDTFTDVLLTTLSLPTGETGASWSAIDSMGIGAVISNADRLRTDSLAGNAEGGTASGSPANANYTVEAVIRRITGAGEAGVMGRAVSGSGGTYYRATLSSAGATSIELYEFVDGAFVLIGSDNTSLSNDTNYTLKLEMVGTAIKVYLDGVQKISATNANIAAAGKAGVYVYTAGAGSDSAGYHVDSISGADYAAAVVSFVADMPARTPRSRWPNLVGVGGRTAAMLAALAGVANVPASPPPPPASSGTLPFGRVGGLRFRRRVGRRL